MSLEIVMKAIKTPMKAADVRRMCAETHESVYAALVALEAAGLARVIVRSHGEPVLWVQTAGGLQ